MKVFLWGMPGSGKSTIGKKLAALLALPFVDLDKVIEEHAGQSIASIFESQGESYFRYMERQMLLETIKRNKNFVMATGGGAPCFFDNLERMKQAGITIFLNMPMAHIVQRMSSKGKAKRPLISGLNQESLEEEFITRFAYRMAYYQQAHYQIKEGDMDASHIASLLKSKSTKN